jgi:hypothetical protein
MTLMPSLPYEQYLPYQRDIITGTPYFHNAWSVAASLRARGSLRKFPASESLSFVLLGQDQFSTSWLD